MRYLTLIILLFLFSSLLFSQTGQKRINATRISTQPQIDGIITQAEWDGLPVLTDFLQYMPFNGEKASENSEVRVGYDDNALYIGAMFYDNEPEKISALVSERDEIDMEINDLISLIISPFDDNNNSFSFVVSATGSQLDRKLLPEGDIDVNWDAVWTSAATVHEKGWSVEIKIPYSALRFPVKDVQDWGFNIWRKINKAAEWSCWSYVDNKTGHFFNQYGKLEGFKNIKPPVRLSFMPYVSGYVEKNADKEWGRTYNAGMDLKYGINESFTLDAILIPDFGQVQSDDQMLNLSPYEIWYNEKRQFFTEGTELFNKGNIFYSRRIGRFPVNYSAAYENLAPGEVVRENPIETKLINAVKVSGRTQGGLGIGLFNAMTSQAEAEIFNPETGITREVETQPFTNYNLLVFDQLISKNSYVSLINTNVKRKDFMANVTATQFRLATSENDYEVRGVAALSYRDLNDDTETGYSVNLDVGKLSGNFKYSYSLDLYSDKYNPNDMGYLRRNNIMTNQVRFDYNIYEPFGDFLDLRNYISFNYTSLYKPGKFSDFYISYQISTTLKNQTYLEMHALWRPVEEHDYFETRDFGKKLILPKGFHNCFTYQSDARKDFSLWSHGGFYVSYDYITDLSSWDIMAEPKYKFNERTSLSWFIYFGNHYNDIGFAGMDGDNTVMGERDVKTIENTFSFNYLFDKNIALSLRARHYWSQATYLNYYNLKDDGYLNPIVYDQNNDINYNAFTFDAAFKWNFLPGSEMSIVWKNTIYSSDKNITEGYFKNLTEVLDAPQTNSLSVKILYYLDYLSL